MTDISAQMVKELRDRTGAGMMDAKKALQKNKGDMEKAIKTLREEGLAKADKKSARQANEGIVECYVHAGGKIGVMVEINCETDFVARTDDFKQLCHDVAMHIAAANPLFLKKEEVDQKTLDEEKDIYIKQAQAEGKPEDIATQIAAGKMAKYYEQNCLLEQSFIKDPDRTINDLIVDSVAKMGENIQIRRFARFQLGQ